MTFLNTVSSSSNGMPSPWTDERIDLLKLRWGQGFSASRIGNEIGLSRGAVIGKIHRLQLEPRRVMVRMPDLNHNRPHRRVQFRVKPKVTVDPQMTVGEPKPIPVYSVNALSEADCRWPYGDPGTAGFHFCGAKKLYGHSYCGPHFRVAYQPKR